MTALRPVLRRDGHVPLYVQIRDRFVADIESGQLRPGEQLPSEPELVTQLRVGRPTVRQAIALLRQEGWVVTRRGSGTFVALPGSGGVSLMDFDGLTRSLAARGFEAHDEVLSESGEDEPPLEVLDVDGAGPWWIVRRVRHVDDGQGTQPLCVEVDAFNLPLCPDAADLFAQTRSAAAVLEASYGYGISSCEVATRAVPAKPRVARQLGVRRGQPLLAMERVNRGADGAIVHIVSYQLRTDRVPVVETLMNPAARR